MLLMLFRAGGGVAPVQIFALVVDRCAFSYSVLDVMSFRRYEVDGEEMGYRVVDGVSFDRYVVDSVGFERSEVDVVRVP